MNILFISKQGSSLSIAKRIQTEGHNVSFFIQDITCREIGNNIIDKPHLQQPLRFKHTTNMLLKETQPDLVIFDDVGLGDVAEHIHSLNIPVLGASKWADFAETDPSYSRQLMKTVGIKFPKTKTFTTEEYDQAVEYTSQGNYISKMSGKDLIVQDNEGIEIDVGFFWNGLNSYLHYISSENEKGSVGTFINSRSKLIKESISKLERLLKKVSYRGQVELKCLVSDEVYGLSLKLHLNMDILAELYRGSLAELFFSLATGSDKVGVYYGDMAIGIVLNCASIDSPVLGVNKENFKHIWFKDVKLNTGYYETTGTHVGLVTARGKDLRECQRRAYRTIHNLTIPDLNYSKDVNFDIKRLRDWL